MLHALCSLLARYLQVHALLGQPADVVSLSASSSSAWPSRTDKSCAWRSSGASGSAEHHLTWRCCACYLTAFLGPKLPCAPAHAAALHGAGQMECPVLTTAMLQLLPLSVAIEPSCMLPCQSNLWTGQGYHLLYRAEAG